MRRRHFCESEGRGFSVRAWLLPGLAIALAGPAGAEPAWRAFFGSVTSLETTGGATLSSLRGDLADFAWPYLVPDPSATLHGSFGRGAVPGGDLRMAPLALSFTAPDGTLEASARAVLEPRHVDTTTGRPLRPGARTRATCTSGAEVDCLAAGDAPAANRAAFDALCDTTRGFSGLDRLACALSIYTSNVPLPPPYGALLVSQEFTVALAGSGFGIDLSAKSALVGGNTATNGRAPLVSLSIDRTDTTGVGTDGVANVGPFTIVANTNALNYVLPGFPLGPTGNGNHNWFQSLDRTLSPQQQALLGCGPFYGTTCDGADVKAGGIDLLHADAGALLQSFAPIADESFLATDKTRAQPGTVGSPVPACDRDDPAGSVVLLPGCRGPGNPGYNVNEDGGDPAVVGIGYPGGEVDHLVPPPGPLRGPVFFFQGHPFTGQAWSSEMAALSWNLQMFLVFSSTPSTSPLLSDPRYGFDPANAYRTDGCSYVKPQLCSAVMYFAAQALDVLADDPHGRPSRRWAWEYGTRYAVESASRFFASLRGGSLFTFGPGAAPIAGGAAAAAARPHPAYYESFLATVPTGDGDADGDGIINIADLCPATADPLQAKTDTDGDGIGDACDDCIAVANADQRDTDGDGFGNACDADLDGNRVVNFADLAKLKAIFFKSDPDADLDGNGVVNFADLARMKQRFFQVPGPSALAP